MSRENRSFKNVRDTTRREADIQVAQSGSHTFRVVLSVHHPVESHVNIAEIEETFVFKVDIASGIVRLEHFVLRQTNGHARLDGVPECSQETVPTELTAIHTHCTTDCVYLCVMFCCPIISS